MDKTLEQKFDELEKRVAELEGQIQAQPRNFIPRTANGICAGKPCKKPD